MSLLSVVVLAAAAATPPPVVVRVGVDLVQTDAVVTDRGGRHVTDLEAKDFELVEDGKVREVTHCQYVTLPPPPARAPSRLAAGDVRRVFAFVIDDNGLSLDSNDPARQALTKFIDVEMGPGDLVAVGRTGYGASTRLLQQFTTDKGLLRAALRDFRAKPATRGPRIADRGMRGMSAARGPVRTADHVEEYRGRMGGSGEAVAAEARAKHEYEIVVPALLKLIETKDMLEGLGQIVVAMHELPGRKALVFLSDSLSLIDGTVRLIRRDEPRVIDPGLLAGVGAITELANRMSVVVHVVSPGGRHLFDDNRNPREQRSSREGDGLGFLAQRTGGLYVRSGNDVMPAFQRVVDDHRGYYVLGYSPDGATFEKKDGRALFRKIEVRVKRPDLVVRARAGYVGVTDAESGNAASRLTAAAFSPLAHHNLGVRLFSSFVHAAPRPGHPTTRAVRARVSVADATVDSNTIQLDVVAAVLDVIGKPVYEVDRAQMRTLSADPAAIVIEFDAPVGKPGRYQVRIAVRDTATGRIGSAASAVEVGDLHDRRLTLAGLITESPTRAGEPVAYSTLAYNAHIDAADEPKIQTRVRLLRDGREVAAGEMATLIATEADPPPARGLGHFSIAGELRIPADIEPGEYILELSATDALAKKDPSAVATTVIELVR